jgi:hypothetical protein
MTKHEIITINLPNGKRKQHMLPEGVRVCEIINLTTEDCDILMALYIHGRRSRYYYAKQGLLPELRRLKSRGFIEAVRLKGNYAYDLTKWGYYSIQNHMV